jgi:hypothetical protein
MRMLARFSSTWRSFTFGLHTVDMTHVVHACFTSPAQSIEGGSGEVTLHQMACHLSFHLLPGWGPPPPDREQEARGPLQNLL